MTVFGPPFYDEDEWEPDELLTQKTASEWISEWTRGGWTIHSGVGSEFIPAPPGGYLANHYAIDEYGRTYRHNGREWAPE